ncbi:DUF1801 domain-containing protein [Paenarthrobacter sp. Z7-10]|uniref:iron chaperone n=1 Tax=Paenarthrobacter sp. Z7-10 TaxID=2787635 RepID=UPI0022A9CDBC|nr:DUF1801 domain-containing protein [Paenarthrobacter sp. Z7-10]MCZ2402210.1 DUF1801 domain-containing protein [Paenarthrobacter sp. Z7-10]
MADRFSSVGEYIGSLPGDVQVLLRQVRGTILDAVPGAEEAISYQIPVVKLNGKHLIYFAAWKHHIGLYPIPVLEDELEKRLAPYRAAKDTIRFPLLEPVPLDLIDALVESLAQRRMNSPR